MRTNRFTHHSPWKESNTKFTWHAGSVCEWAVQILTLSAVAKCFIYLFICCIGCAKLLHMGDHPHIMQRNDPCPQRVNWTWSTMVAGNTLYVFVCCVPGIWSTSLCPPTPVQTTTLRRVPTTSTLRWLLRGLRLSCPKQKSSPSSSTQLTELTLGTRSVTYNA